VSEAQGLKRGQAPEGYVRGTRPPDGHPIANDGLPAREIKAHTLEKFDRHGKYCGIFNRGMSRYWADNRGYLELFAGSGLVITETGDELDGCPLIAANPDFDRSRVYLSSPPRGFKPAPWRHASLTASRHSTAIDAKSRPRANRSLRLRPTHRPHRRDAGPLRRF
jgi:hypothetical protein